MELVQQDVQVSTGGICDASIIAAACRAAGPDALVISTMGGTQDYLVCRTVTNETEKADIARVILVTSLGCGDSWPSLSERVKAAFGQAVQEKTLAEGWLQTSQLDHAILRPDGLFGGATTSEVQRIQNQGCHGLTSRADVATHIHKLVNTSASNQQVYSLIESDLKPTRSFGAACPRRNAVTEFCISGDLLSSAKVFMGLPLLLLILMSSGISQGVLKISFDALFDEEYRDI